MVTFIEHHRRSIRLPGADYSVPGFYFITICTKNREHLFGEIQNGEMILNELGEIVAEEWYKTAEIRKEIVLDEFQIMPNHVHGIVGINDVDDRGTVGANGRSPLPPTPPDDVRRFECNRVPYRHLYPVSNRQSHQKSIPSAKRPAIPSGNAIITNT